MTELCNLFNVSMNTVRRDVAELRRRGAVEKVYGGVCAVENGGSVLRPFAERQTIADAAKRAIDAFGAVDTTDWNHLKNNVRDAVQHYIYETLKRNPMILPIIVEI